jgi:hypothetical protein
MKLSDEFSFAIAMSIHRLGASRWAAGDATEPETFLNEKHPKIHSFTYSGWRLQPWPRG